MRIKRIGKFGILSLGLLLSSLSWAEVQFHATVDRNQVTVDESVALKLSVESDGQARVGSVNFDAPDFDVVNEYNSTQAQSYYDGTTGRFGMKTTQEVTKVLRPRKTGSFRIGGILAEINGKNVRAPDLQIQVLGSGAATQPPRGYGGSGIGLRGAAKRGNGPLVKLRAEVDKSRVYKGEQLIVSYYLYRRVRVFNISVDKFPILNGFLREDLEMPILGQRLDSERVMLDGVPYERSLVMRYAAYPLQEGTLKIDPAGLKYAYYPRMSAFDDEDPFAGFFQQLNPAQGSDRSDPVPVEVLPLPEADKPQSFTGGVGDFGIVAAVNKNEVRANEALTLTMKVEGRGNTAAIGEPKFMLPPNVELYDSKGTSKSGRLGVGQKVFEWVLIPRTPGKITLPAVELSYYDPAKKQYVRKHSDPIEIQVGEPTPGTSLVNAPGASSSAASPGQNTEPKKATILGLKWPQSDAPAFGIPVWRILAWLSSGLLVWVFGLMLSDLWKKQVSARKRSAAAQAKDGLKVWAKLKEEVGSSEPMSWNQVLESYEKLAGLIFDALDEVYAVNSRSRPRSELVQILTTEHGLSSHLWQSLAEVLERTEVVRFASQVGAVSESDARAELRQWVQKAEGAVLELKNPRKGPRI